MGERLAAARGAVRDGVAAVEGLAQLLGSRRVGPRGVARALPEVRDGCAALRASLGALDEVIAAEVAGDAEAAAAAGATLAHAALEVERIEAELGGRGADARPAAIDARRRLALEASVRRAAGELAGALELVDLLCASLDPRPTAIDLADVLRERSATGPPLAPAVQVSAACERAEGLEADARVVGGLIELALGAARVAGLESLRITSRRRADGRVEVRVDGGGTGRAGADAIALELPARADGACALDVARAVARRAGIGLAIEPGGAVTLTL